MRHTASKRKEKKRTVIHVLRDYESALMSVGEKKKVGIEKP